MKRSKRQKPVRALLTSGAGPGVAGIVHALRAHPLRHIHIVVGDVENRECAGFMLADETCILPSAFSRNYLAAMLAICKKHQIDIILPLFSGELDSLAQARAAFKEIGVELLLPETKSVLMANNKGAFYEHLATLGIAIPAYKRVKSFDELENAVREMGYPAKTVCLKPEQGTGNRGFHVISEKHNRFRAYFEMKPDNTVCTWSDIVSATVHCRPFPTMVAMEFLQGQEYGADVLSKNGEVLAMRIRKKLPPERLGMHFRVEYVQDNSLEKLVHDTVAALKCSYVTSIDIRCDQKGNPYILEMNPRPGAYIGMTCAEINLLAAAIDMLLGGKEVDMKAYRTGRVVKMGVRYFNDFVLYSDKSNCTF